MKEAVILAGGHGWRLKPLVYVQKPLIYIKKDETLLSRQIKWLLQCGFDRVHVSIGELTPEEIEQHMINGKVCIHQNQVGTKKPGTGGGLYRTFEYVKSPMVYVFNIDDILFHNPIEIQRTSIHVSKIVITFPPSPWGVVDYNNSGMVVDFVEKPMLPFTVSVGHYWFHRSDIESYCPDEGDLEMGMLPKMVADHRLGTHLYRGTWLTVNTYKDLMNVRKYFYKNALYI